MGFLQREELRFSGRGKGYQPKPKAEADNLTETFIIQYNTKTESHNCFIIREKTKKNESHVLASLTGSHTKRANVT